MRRIRYVRGNQAPVVAASAATRPPGSTPLTVTFSSAGSSDPEGQPLTYSWTFGDGDDLDGGEPVAHLPHAGHVPGAADRLGRREHDDLDADHDQRRGVPDGDDPVAGRRAAVPGRAT